MKREFLKGLELEDEVIEKIMKEHGKSTQKLLTNIETLQEKNADLLTQIADKDKEYFDLEKDLKDANKKISDFEQIDVEALKKENKEWEEKYNKRELDIKIDKFMDEYEFTSDLAKKATLSEFKNQNFKLDKNGELKGAKEFMEKFVEENKTAFVVNDDTESGTNNDPDQNNTQTNTFTFSPYNYVPQSGGDNGDSASFEALLDNLSKIN